MTSSNGNIFRVTGPLCGEFTGPGEFPTQRPVTRSFDVFFDLRLNKRLNKQPWGWWFETPSWSLWCHCNAPPNYKTSNWHSRTSQYPNQASIPKQAEPLHPFLKNHCGLGTPYDVPDITGSGNGLASTWIIVYQVLNIHPQNTSSLVYILCALVCII